MFSNVLGICYIKYIQFLCDSKWIIKNWQLEGKNTWFRSQWLSPALNRWHETKPTTVKTLQNIKQLNITISF